MTTNSLINAVMGAETIGQPSPTVGMGGTILMWTDRVAVTVIAVNTNKTRVVVQEDLAVRTDSNGLSEVQSYAYRPNPNGRTTVFTLRKNGAWVRAKEPMTGTRLTLGRREAYRDPSF